MLFSTVITPAIAWFRGRRKTVYAMIPMKVWWLWGLYDLRNTMENENGPVIVGLIFFAPIMLILFDLFIYGISKIIRLYGSRGGKNVSEPI